MKKYLFRNITRFIVYIYMNIHIHTYISICTQISMWNVITNTFSRTSSSFDVCFRQCYLFFHLVWHLVCRWLLFSQSFLFTIIISMWWRSWIKSVRILLEHNMVQFTLTIDTISDNKSNWNIQNTIRNTQNRSILTTNQR